MLTPPIRPASADEPPLGAAPPGHRWTSRPDPGFAALVTDVLVAAYHRLRETGASHATALGALGEWITLVVLVADYVTGSIEAGGTHAGDRTGYRHQLINPEKKAWAATRKLLAAAGLLAVIDDPGSPRRGVVTGIPERWFRSLCHDTTATTADGHVVDRRFVPMNRTETRRFVADLRTSGGGARSRMLASLVLLWGHTDQVGFLLASERDLAARLDITPDQAHRMIAATVRAGYVSRGDRRRTGRGYDPSGMPFMGEVRDRVGGRRWTVTRVADEASTAERVASSESRERCWEIHPPDHGETTPTLRESTSREDYTPHLGSSPPRTSWPRRDAVGGANRPGWQVGPGTRPTHAEWTVRCVEVLELNLPSLHELLDAYDHKQLGRGIRQAVRVAAHRARAVVADHEAGRPINDDDRDLVDAVARLARNCDGVVRTGHVELAHHAVAQDDPDPARPGGHRYYDDGVLRPEVAVRLLAGRITPIVAQAKRSPRWEATAGNWRTGSNHRQAAAGGVGTITVDSSTLLRAVLADVGAALTGNRGSSGRVTPTTE